MTQKKRRLSRTGRRSEEGAVMLVVMLILLMTTATATFAIYATSTEIRAAGHARRAMQTNYVGEAGVLAAMDWVDTIHPSTVAAIMAQLQTDYLNSLGGSTDPRLDLAPFEPPLATFDPTSPTGGVRIAHRLYVEDVSPEAPTTQGEVDRTVFPADSFGPMNARQPDVVVDLYDYNITNSTVPGFTANGQMKHFQVTYTSRGRASLRSTVTTGSASADLFQTAGDARAFARSGPYASM